MGGKPQNAQSSVLSPQAVLDELDRVLSSKAFCGAERSSRFLRFVVEQTLNGHGTRLKEYTLATEALGKSAAFDPRNDAIVRAEASRLRDRLGRYYAAEGKTDPIVIELPKGSYVPLLFPRIELTTATEHTKRTPRPPGFFWLAVSISAATFVILALFELDAPGRNRPSADVSAGISFPAATSTGANSGDSPQGVHNIAAEGYGKYLRARALWEARGLAPETEDRNLVQAAALLEAVVASDPAYAPAWALLGGTYYGLASNSTRVLSVAAARAAANEFRIKGEAAAKRSLEWDPGVAQAYTSLAVFAWSRGKLADAEQLFANALARDPHEPNALGAYAIRLGSAGRLKEALDFAERAYAVDPLYPNVAREAAQDRWLNGQNESAIALAKTLRPGDRATLLALIYASMGRDAEAANALEDLVADDRESGAADAGRVLRMTPSERRSVQLPRLPNSLSMLYLYLAHPERALDWDERTLAIGFLYGSQAVFWHSDYAPVRRTERFKQLVRKAGFVEYWRAKGWPSQCHPTTGDDFECS